MTATKDLEELTAELMDFVRSVAHENGYQFKQVGNSVAEVALDPFGVQRFEVRIDAAGALEGPGRHFFVTFHAGKVIAPKGLYAGTKEQLQNFLTPSEN